MKSLVINVVKLNDALGYLERSKVPIDKSPHLYLVVGNFFYITVHKVNQGLWHFEICRDVLVFDWLTNYSSQTPLLCT